MTRAIVVHNMPIKVLNVTGEQCLAFLKAARATLRMGYRNFIEQVAASISGAVSVRC